MSIYDSQIKYIKDNLIKFGFNIDKEIIFEFRYKCKRSGSTPTTEIKKFINDYNNRNDFFNLLPDESYEVEYRKTYRRKF